MLLSGPFLQDEGAGTLEEQLHNPPPWKDSAVSQNIKCTVLVPFYLHTLGGDKMKAILPSGQEHQPFQAPHHDKGSTPKSSEHAWLLRTVRAASSEGLVQCYPQVWGSVQQYPEVLCPRRHPFRGWSLCCSVFYGQVGPIKHLTHSAGAFLLTPVGFGSGSPWSALSQTLTFSNFRGGSAGKLNRVPMNCCKKYTNKIFIK